MLGPSASLNVLVHPTLKFATLNEIVTKINDNQFLPTNDLGSTQFNN